MTERVAAPRQRQRSDGSPEPRKPDSSVVIDKLKTFIEAGGYKPGMRLPPERALAEELHIGRPALREAIKALSILDVLESRRGDGTYLRSLDALRAGRPGRLEISDTSFSMLDLLELRKMIEPRSAALAASRANESQLRRIERERTTIENNQDWPRIGLHDYLLHEAIMGAAGNAILTSVSRFLAPLLRKSREITAANAPDRTTMLNDHSAIVEAIVKGEADAAEQAMLRHLNNVGLDLISERRR